MVQRKKTTDTTGTIGLCLTYSDDGYKLKQEGTGEIYSSECIDKIADYDERGVPYSRYTYTETDEKDEPSGGTDVEKKAAAFDYLMDGGTQNE